MDFSYSNKILLKLYYLLPVFIREWVGALYSFKVKRRRFSGAFVAQLNELLGNEKLSAAERVKIQLNQLKDTLVYASEYSPFYRRLFSTIGFNPNLMQSSEDIQIIPLLAKDIIRTQYRQLLAENYFGPTMINHTSGTTGSALNITISEEANQRNYACAWFHFGWAGVSKGDRVATFGAHPVAPMKKLTPPFWLYDRTENDLMFSAYHLTPRTVQFYAQKLVDFCPDMIRGYPSLIYLVALHLLETDNQMIHPKGIFTYAETTLDHQRQVIEGAFGCPVYSSYGNGERAGHLLQCRDGNFHIVTETCFVEVIRSDGKPANPGEMGELVVTSLINKAMPMIRYRTGDTAIQADGMCTCGRTSPILKEITGRIEDFVITPDGRHLGRLDRIFKLTSNIKEAQIVQEKIDTIIVNIVPRQGYGKNDERLLINDLQTHLGNDIDIQIRVVDEIQKTQNGKFRFVISKVPVRFTD